MCLELHPGLLWNGVVEVAGKWKHAYVDREAMLLRSLRKVGRSAGIGVHYFSRLVLR